MPSTEDLINVWILADEKLMPRLQNEAIKALNNSFASNAELPTEIFGHVYNHTMEGSPLRRIIVDLWFGQLGKVEFADHFPRAMLVDLLKAVPQSKNVKAAKFSNEKMKQYLVDEEVLVSRPSQS